MSINLTAEQRAVLAVADDWLRNYAPTDMVQNEKNAGILVLYCLDHFGVVTTSGLTQAYNARRTTLDLVSPSKAKSELAAKLEAKMRKDFADSVAPNSTLGRQKANQEKADAEKKAASEKELKAILSQIESEIENYTKGHVSGATDYSATESGRNSLRRVRDSQDRRTIQGAKLALSAVRAEKMKM
jgi:hypothetical protein